MNAVTDAKANSNASPNSGSVQVGAVAPLASAISPANNSTEFVQAFTHAMTHDDVEGLVNLWASDGEWVIMATGETFRGLDQIRQLATRSVAARNHAAGEGLLPFNVFADSQGTKFCWEYAHKGVVTDQWPSSSAVKPAPGTKFDLPIVLMCEIRNGRLIKIREYFDLLTLTEPGTPHHLYS
jgi:ketosteroid isomerase-like protein